MQVNSGSRIVCAERSQSIHTNKLHPFTKFANFSHFTWTSFTLHCSPVLMPLSVLRRLCRRPMALLKKAAKYRIQLHRIIFAVSQRWNYESRTSDSSVRVACFQSFAENYSACQFVSISLVHTSHAVCHQSGLDIIQSLHSHLTPLVQSFVVQCGIVCTLHGLWWAFAVAVELRIEKIFHSTWLVYQTAQINESIFRWMKDCAWQLDTDMTPMKE